MSGSRSQGSIEYILLVGGILLFAAIVLLVTRENVVGGVTNRIQQNGTSINQIIDNITNTTPNT